MAVEVEQFNPDAADTWHARFSAKVREVDGCLVWTGALDKDGYGKFWDGAKVARAPRAAWDRFVGPIPPGLQVDHLCRNRACVNVAHLEVVTRRENLRRSDGLAGVNARKTTCDAGHALSGDNLYSWRGKRYCRTCRRDALNRLYQRRRQVAV